MLGEDWGKIKSNEQGRQKLEKAEFVAVDEAYRAIFPSNLGFKERTIDSFRFSAEGIFTFASTASQCEGYCVRTDVVL